MVSAAEGNSPHLHDAEPPSLGAILAGQLFQCDHAMRNAF